MRLYNVLNLTRNKIINLNILEKTEFSKVFNQNGDLSTNFDSNKLHVNLYGE